MSGNINDIAYQGMKQVENIYATADGDKSGTIDLNEAKNTQAGKSVFDQMAETYLNEEVAKFNTQGKGDLDTNLVKKYLGNNTLENGVKSLFKVISYNSGSAKDQENAETVKQSIDYEINKQVKEQIDSIKIGLKEQYGEAVQKAVAQAAKQQFGLMNDDYNYDKKQDGDVATYEGASLGKKETDKATAGYKATTDKLKDAKTLQREVNGEMQTIYVFHENGKKRRVVIDDAGQMHDLKTVSGGGSLEKNTYITEDAYQLAQEQSALDNKKVKIQRLKVDGKYENTYKDSEGNVHKIDHNNANGENFYVKVKKVSHGGEKKYGTDTSGYANSGKDKRTQRGRNKADIQGLNEKTYDLTTGTHIPTVLDKLHLDEFGGTVKDLGDNKYQVSINGHQYDLDFTKNKETDDKLSWIKSELDTLSKVNSGDTTINNAIIEDTRTDAGDWGVKENHESKHPERINTITYQKSTFTRSNFQREGWKASAGRQREAEILKKMDDYGVKKDGTHTRNLKSANDFAARFLAVQGEPGKKYNENKLAQALTIANPSLFDSNGDMKKNVDFNRINLPQNIRFYELND